MRRRTGFTLVELMVAMALTVFIMVILTQAFVLSIDTFIGLKAIGDMQENLRAGANVMRFDLAQNHFDGMRRTSDPNFNMPREGFVALNMDGVRINSAKTPQGQKKAPYFIVVYGVYRNIYPGMVWSAPGGYADIVGPIVQPNVPAGMTTIQVGAPPAFPNDVPIYFTQQEGSDLDGMTSSMSTFDTLHMSCRLKGNRQESFYSTPVVDVPPPQGLPSFFAQRTFYNLTPTTEDADATLRNPTTGPFYRSQWAEVFYFLGSTDPATGGIFQPSGTTEEPLNPFGTGVPLYSLYRAQWVVVTDNTQVNNVPNTSVNPATVGYPITLLPNFQGIACNGFGNPQNASAINFYTPTDLAQGNRTISNGNLSRAFAPAPTMVVPNVLSWQVQAIYGGGYPQEGFYDSASANPQIPLKGVAITIRVWDNKTRQTRQLTITQDL